MDATADPSTGQAPPPALLISSRRSLSDFLKGCDHAQTLTAYELDTGAEVVIPLDCRSWGCRYCAEVRIRRLAAMTRDAKPNRMLTLTIDPKLWQNPRHAFDGTRRQISPLISTLRGRFGQVEYLRCTELTANGWPHYHMLIRSNFLPHAVIKAEWQRLTGAQIVDVRQVKQHFHAYTYLVKYLSKLHKITWTERHLSYSRGFFPPAKPDLPSGRELASKQIINTHPVEYLFTNCQGTTVERVSPRYYRLTHNDQHKETF